MSFSWHFHTYVLLCLAHICPPRPRLPSAVCSAPLTGLLPPSKCTLFCFHVTYTHMYIYLDLDFTYVRKSDIPFSILDFFELCHKWLKYYERYKPRLTSVWGFSLVTDYSSPFEYSRSMGRPPHCFPPTFPLSGTDVLWLCTYPPIPVPHLNLSSRSPPGKRCWISSLIILLSLNTAYLTSTHPLNLCLS